MTDSRIQQIYVRSSTLYEALSVPVVHFKEQPEGEFAKKRAEKWCMSRWGSKGNNELCCPEDARMQKEKNNNN